jgi:sugar phosphate isomerase/epimerase
VHHLERNAAALAPFQADQAIAARSWSYVTLGYGHGEQWWRGFCYRLRMAGDDCWLSIEHQDVMLSPEGGADEIGGVPEERGSE